jgi:hypothetical protein
MLGGGPEVSERIKRWLLKEENLKILKQKRNEEHPCPWGTFVT